MSVAPWPLRTDELDATFAALESGTSWREAFEALLLALPLERAEPLMLLHREGRGGWLPLARSPDGDALCVGNAFSGTWVALARAGFRPTLVDDSVDRLRFARWRILDCAGIEPRCVLASQARALPFADGAFALAVLEPALERSDVALAPSELARVAREAVLVADNRFGYKRSDGHRGGFVIAGPCEFARRSFAPHAGERTLAGHRRALAGHGTRAFALYPHAQDWTHAVALDAPLPALRIGPKERKNRLKTLAYAAGLFPLLAPSFALFLGPAGPTRAERMLADLAERLGESRLELEELVATRGNNALLFVHRAGDADDAPDGRYLLHVPLAAFQRAQVERHARTLALLAQRFPSLPVPELLFAGELGGTWLTCERRLPGLTAPQLSGDVVLVERTLSDLARTLEGLVVEPPRPWTRADFDAHVSTKFSLVAARCGHAATRARLARMLDEAREQLVGRALPLVFAHADLRSKHVQVDAHGGLVGLLDWGCADPRGLPGFDLTHFLVHEWKQSDASSPGAAWRRLLARERRDELLHERLLRHGLALGVDAEAQRALAAIHPVLVGAVAEANWDYSRPRWLQRGYEL